MEDVVVGNWRKKELEFGGWRFNGWLGAKKRGKPEFRA